MSSPVDNRPRVLVAEDDPDVRRLLGRLLASRGCQAVMVGTGEEALDRARDADWDLLVTDVQMPGMDGIELTRRLREHERRIALGSVALPIVAVTAHALDRFRDEAARAGTDGFLEKPVTRAGFEEVIAPHVAPRRRLLVVEDALDSRRLLGRQLEAADWRVVLAESGEQGLAFARPRPFDAAILDLELPGRSGWETAAALRDLPGADLTHLVALTAHDADDRDERLHAAGFRALLQKPARLSAIQRALTPASQRPPRASVRPPPLPTAGQAVVVDEDVADLVPGFLDNRRRDAERLQALAADPAPIDGEARRIGHSMKGSGAGYGFPRVSEIGAAIEAAAGDGDRASVARLAGELETYLDGVVVVVDSSGGSP